MSIPEAMAFRSHPVEGAAALDGEELAWLGAAAEYASSDKSEKKLAWRAAALYRRPLKCRGICAWCISRANGRAISPLINILSLLVAKSRRKMKAIERNSVMKLSKYWRHRWVYRRN